MRILISVLLLSCFLLAKSEAGEKFRIELYSEHLVDDAECQSVLGDSIQVTSPDYTGWIQISQIRLIQLRRPSNIVVGAGLGAIGGVITGYIIGKSVDSNNEPVDPFASSQTSNRKFTYAMFGGGIGLFVGGIMGIVSDPQTDFYFSKMSDDEKQQLIRELITSPSQ